MSDDRAPAPREASGWTQPLQAAVSAFFVVSAGVNLVIVLAFSALYRQYYTALYARTLPSGSDVVAQADAAVTGYIGLTVLIALIYLVLAALTYFRRATWLFVVDMVVLLVAGAPALVLGVMGLVRPGSTTLPPVFGLTQLLLSLVALSLVILMAGLSVRYGVWAQRRGAVGAME